MEALAGLPLVFLHLRKLAMKAVCRIKTLSDMHPIRSLLMGPERKKAKPHALSLSKLGNPERMNRMQSAITEVQQIIEGLTEVLEPSADEACPGARVIDLYPQQIMFLDWKARDPLHNGEDPEEIRSEPGCLREVTEGNLPGQEGQHMSADVSILWNMNQGVPQEGPPGDE